MSNQKEILKSIYFKAIKNSFSKKKIEKYLQNDIYIFSVGKAAITMARICEEVLGSKIKGGLVISNSSEKLQYIKTFTSSHPSVTKKSIKASKLLLEEIEKLNKNDKFIFLLSGGASAMIEQPIDGLTLKDFIEVSDLLLKSGIDIKALNTVRKSISNIKSGKLANKFKTKNGVVLILSDVIGDDTNTIGSAPMNNGEFIHHIIGNNLLALKKAKKEISKTIKNTKILTTTLDLPSYKAASYIDKQIKKYDKKYEEFCLLIGGETTTKVKGNGIGGRNLELALRLLLKKSVTKDISILCAGSDGADGNSPATGAFLDFDIYNKIKSQNLKPKQYLQNSDSYNFFKALNYDFTTGFSGINVMDFIIILKTKG